MPLIAVCIVSLMFWTGVSTFTGVGEPWDLANFWTLIYPAALVLSAVMGAMLKRAQWSAGAVMMFAQIPVILVHSGVSALLGAGIVYAAVLSIPAVALAWFAGRLRRAYSGQ